MKVEKEKLFIAGMWIIVALYILLAFKYLLFPLGLILLISHIVLIFLYKKKKSFVYIWIALSLFLFFLIIQFANSSECSLVIRKGDFSGFDCKCVGIQKTPFGESVSQCVGVRTHCYVEKCNLINESKICDKVEVECNNMRAEYSEYIDNKNK